jgi:hypothetical protein
LISAFDVSLDFLERQVPGDRGDPAGAASRIGEAPAHRFPEPMRGQAQRQTCGADGFAEPIREISGRKRRAGFRRQEGQVVAFPSLQDGR